jgi:hypothetical protein
MRHPLRAAFPRGGADRFGGFGLDQFLDPELGELTNQISSAALVDHGKYFVDGRLRQSHRRVLLGVQLDLHTEPHAGDSPHGGPEPKPHHAKGLIRADLYRLHL